MVKCRDLYCTSFMGAMGLLNIKVTYKDTCCCVNESMWIYCKTKYAYCIYIYIYIFSRFVFSFLNFEINFIH